MRDAFISPACGSSSVQRSWDGNNQRWSAYRTGCVFAQPGVGLSCVSRNGMGLGIFDIIEEKTTRRKGAASPNTNRLSMLRV